MDVAGGHYATSERGPDGALVDKSKEELLAAKNRVIEQQAREGKMPGAMLMQDRLSGEKRQEVWGNVSDDMYDEGAAQSSYITPGLDAGIGGGDTCAPPSAAHANEGDVILAPHGGAVGGTADGGGRAGEGAVCQPGDPGGLADGGGCAGEGAVSQSSTGGGATYGGGCAGEDAVQQPGGGDGMVVGSGPGSGAY